MSLVLSGLKHFFWLFFPPLFFLSAVLSLYFFNTELAQSWLINLQWMTYVSLAIAAMIAWQFGRSRLVYACLLLLFIAAGDLLTLTPALIEIRYSGILLGFVFLMYTKDKGFSVLNLCFTMAMLLLLFVFSGLAIPSLQDVSQTWLTSLDSRLFQLSPDIRAHVSPFNSLLLILGLLLGWLRLCLKTDNTHNALYFALALSAVMQIYQGPEFVLISIVSLSAVFCYSVLIDSFTMAFKDELTGIPSRRALMQYVHTLGRRYTVVMCDIDHFKNFNDSYGHDVGDEVLKLVASKLDDVTGSGKTFRFGGEEFIIVFPRKTTTQVLPFVELVRQTIADYDITLRVKPRQPKPTGALANKAPAKMPTEKKIVKVTISFGVAQRGKALPDFASIMKQADTALYSAKKAGRNCVKVAQQ